MNNRHLLTVYFLCLFKSTIGIHTSISGPATSSLKRVLVCKYINCQSNAKVNTNGKCVIADKHSHTNGLCSVHTTEQMPPCHANNSSGEPNQTHYKTVCMCFQSLLLLSNFMNLARVRHIFSLSLPLSLCFACVVLFFLLRSRAPSTKPKVMNIHVFHSTTLERCTSICDFFAQAAPYNLLNWIRINSIGMAR